MILDESSMLDLDLLGVLAEVFIMKKISYQICFVGDYYQIAPVSRGELFRQIVEDGKNVNIEDYFYKISDKEQWVFGYFTNKRITQ